MIASTKVAAGVGKVVLFIVSSAQMPISKAAPAIGGKTLSQNSRASNGCRVDAGLGGGGATLFSGAAALGSAEAARG